MLIEYILVANNLKVIQYIHVHLKVYVHTYIYIHILSASPVM